MIFRGYFNSHSLGIRMAQLHPAPEHFDVFAADAAIPALVFQSTYIKNVFGHGRRTSDCSVYYWRPFLHFSELAPKEFNEPLWLQQGFEDVAMFGTGAFTRAPSVNRYLSGLVATANHFPNDLGPHRFNNLNPLRQLALLLERAKGHNPQPLIDTTPLPRNLKLLRGPTPYSPYNF